MKTIFKRFEKRQSRCYFSNPPFGEKLKKHIQENFPIRTSETSYLFLQHFIKKLKVGGRGAVAIKKLF